MSSNNVAALTLTVSALLICGCGTSSSTTGVKAPSRPLTKSQLIAKADPICARFFVKFHAHGTKTAKEFVGNLRLLLSFERTESEELRKLTPPASMSSDWNKILTGQRTLTDDSARLLTYVRQGKLQAARPLLSAAQSARSQETALARRNGFKDCSRIT
jgi:hypothetical protein